MTDKERIERILKIINLEYPDRIKLGKRMNEVYKILAMDELELLTLDQYRGQNMDFVLEKLQKEGLALGDTMRQLDRQIAERFDVKVVDLQSDLALLNQFDVENIRDLPKQITQGMSIEPRNKPPEADYYNKLFEEIAEQNPLDEPNITLNPDGSTTEKLPGGGEINRNVPIEEFGILFGGSPKDTKMPAVLDDIKGTQIYDRTQFHLWSMNLEYQERKKFLNLIMQQYDIAFDYAKNLSTEDKKILMEAMSDRLLRLDERYKDITVKKDVDLSLQELEIFDNLIENDAKNLKKELPGLIDEIKLQNLDIPVDKDLEEGFKIQDNLETSAADEIDGVGLTDEDLNLSTENDNFLLDETDPRNKEKFDEIVSNIDEPLDQNVIDFREKQLEKIIKEVEDATPDVTKITSSQAEMIDNALADAAANLRRGTFESIPGGKGSLTKAIKNRLVSILGDGLNALDAYELGLLLGAVGQPALDPIVKIIFPDVPDDNRPYKERVLENIQRTEQISPTAKAVKKIAPYFPEPVDREYTIYGVPSNRAVQFTSMYGMLGGNNGK